MLVPTRFFLGISLLLTGTTAQAYGLKEFLNETVSLKETCSLMRSVWTNNLVSHAHGKEFYLERRKNTPGKLWLCGELPADPVQERPHQLNCIALGEKELQERGFLVKEGKSPPGKGKRRVSLFEPDDAKRLDDPETAVRPLTSTLLQFEVSDSCHDRIRLDRKARRLHEIERARSSGSRAFFIADPALAIVDHLRKRFSKKRIYAMARNSVLDFEFGEERTVIVLERKTESRGRGIEILLETVAKHLLTRVQMETMGLLIVEDTVPEVDRGKRFSIVKANSLPGKELFDFGNALETAVEGLAKELAEKDLEKVDGK